jgi:histidinol-phosphate aminotransferase
MSLVRPGIDRIEGYTPGEQPQESGWVKLNTNENPYPPSPRVVAAIHEAAGGPLNKYPDPLARRFCRAAGELFGVDPDSILPANGSDENLTILMRTFVDPGELTSSPYPSYVLYATLADLQGARYEPLPLRPDFRWDHAACRPIVERSKLVFVPNPNSPSGNRWPDEDLLALVPPQGLLVLDEAYGDFCDQPHRAELLRRENGPRIILTRTLSKSYSLAGLRFGFAIADPQWVHAMRKVKDSYNCDALSLAGALAAIEDQEWMQQNVSRIRETRGRLTSTLRKLGFDVIDSQANFVWSTRAERRHREIYEALKQRRILVRYMQFPLAGPQRAEHVDGLRITVGTDAEIDQLLTALEGLV